MKTDLRGRPRPGIVVIHGGGWIEGDKSSFVFRDRRAPANIVDFARQGFVAVTINYRLAPRPRSRPQWKTARRRCAGCGRMRKSTTSIAAISAPMAIRPAAASRCCWRWLARTQVSKGTGPIGRVEPGPGGRQRQRADRPDPSVPQQPDRRRDRAVHGRSARGGSPRRLPKASPSLTSGATRLAAVDLRRLGPSDPDRHRRQFVLALGKAGAEDVTYHRLALTDHCPHSLVAIPEMQRAVEEFFLRTLMHPETARDIRRWKRK